MMQAERWCINLSLPLRNPIAAFPRDGLLPLQAAMVKQKMPVKTPALKY
jgi:hypothetical protein